MKLFHKVKRELLNFIPPIFTHIYTHAHRERAREREREREREQIKHELSDSECSGLKVTV